MRIASLGSGSKGNATLVDTGETLILIDCGLPRKEVESRLAHRGLSARDLDAILVIKVPAPLANPTPPAIIVNKLGICLAKSVVQKSAVAKSAH